MINNIEISSFCYKNINPFPYYYQDNILNEDFAKKLQEEILNIDDKDWDRYENPFEKKFTLRNKFNFPPLLKSLFEELTTEKFVNKLSNICGYNLFLDESRNFWGVHKYKNEDKLDIHVDAGLHPNTKQKKQLTLGIYLSSNWKENYGCKLEIWKGDNASDDSAKIYEKVDEISPIFNRLVLFTCNDYSWHGNPEPVVGENDAKRIFITISYLSDNLIDQNKRTKAFFVPRPSDPEDNEKDKLRFLRSDPEKYKYVYRT